MDEDSGWIVVEYGYQKMNESSEVVVYPQRATVYHLKQNGSCGNKLVKVKTKLAEFYLMTQVQEGSSIKGIQELIYDPKNPHRVLTRDFHPCDETCDFSLEMRAKLIGEEFAQRMGINVDDTCSIPQ